MRETVKCIHCKLNQFKTEKCRRCGKPTALPEAPQYHPHFLPSHKALQDAGRDLERAAAAAFLLLRNFRELSQPQLGKLMGVNRTFISKLECGKAAPTVRSIRRLSAALNFSMSFVVHVIEQLARGIREERNGIA